MAKDGFLTPKAISNRIKAKGLQKLRWYCQMCQKQCRDANGFKCHLTSESHRRQMEIFTQNQGKFMDSFSRQFEKQFMDLVSRKYRSKKILATRVYNEHISDREHVHMNATRWSSLTEFVHYLGREGKVTVEESPKGWYIRYIDKAEIERRERAAKKERAQLDEEERQKREMKRMFEASKAVESEEHGDAGSKKEETRFDGKVQFGLKLSGKGNKHDAALAEEGSAAALPLGGVTNEEQQGIKRKRPDIGNVFDDDGDDGRALLTTQKRQRREMSELERLRQEQERQEQLRQDRMKSSEPRKAGLSTAPSSSSSSNIRKDKPWLLEGIVVKVLNKKLEKGAYYKKKGVVIKLQAGGYAADIEIIGSGDVLRVDQKQLETVLPRPPNDVLLLRGTHRGVIGTMTSVEPKKFCCTVQLKDGTELTKVEYEDVCKVASNHN